MTIKISKEEWEEFLKWKESKQRPKKEESEKEETLEIEDDVFDDILEEVEEEGKKETYICPVCGYEDTKPFERCPKCGTKLEWD